MSHNRPPLPVILLVLLTILGTAGYFLWQNFAAPTSTALTASGTVEAAQTSISSEASGRALNVLAGEGDFVSAGDTLLTLDATLLQAQRDLAAASLNSAKAAVTTAQAGFAAAQAQYQLTLSAALAEETAQRTADWKETEPGDYNQPSWYFSRAEQLAAYEKDAESAQAALQKTEENLKFYEEKAASGDFLAAEARLAQARAAYQSAQAVLDATSSGDQELRDAAQTAFDDALSELDDAQQEYEDALTTEGAQDVLTARAELRVAQERASLASDQVRALQTGQNSPKVFAAQQTLAQAEAAVAQAQSAVAQAEANLALLDVQIQKLTTYAPTDGVVLTRSVEPGEVVNPGAVLLTLANLSNLSITVYIPEDRYGEVSLGQSVQVTVDSFPGETFAATVSAISDRAEFTPRNVQTVDGRKTTVFAITLQLEDSQGKLKPGMPADVVFE